MSYWLHPEAAEEHKNQITRYEEIQAGLGKRYHTDFQNVLAWVCASPDRSRIGLPPDIRRAMFKVFHFDLVYRDSRWLRSSVGHRPSSSPARLLGGSALTD